MALTILNRPEKTLDNGYLSRWNASRTPLQYKFSSNLFPVNTVDTPSATQQIGPYDSSKKGMRFATFAMDKYEVGDWVKIENSPVDGVYKVIEKESSSIYYLDLYDTGTYTVASYPTMSDNKYYKGYKGIVKVFAGAPEYHPYNTDGSKPQREIGEIQVDFDANNEGICNVRNFVKPDMGADFDENDENSHEAWTSFAIEYAEFYEGIDSITFEEDILTNCTPFDGFSNESFDNGLTDWSQEGGSINWTAGTGELIMNGTGATTAILYQGISLQVNVPYQLEINYNLISGTVSDNIIIRVWAQGLDDVFEVVYFEQNIQIGSGVGFVDVSPTKQYKSLGIQVQAGKPSPDAFEFRLQYLQVTSSVGNQCKYSSFATFGAKQFQDSLGGNFGDYIASSQIQGKLLTHFEELKFPFYVNSLIPNSTFAESEGGNSIFLETFCYDKQGNEKEYIRQKIENKSDGVYTVGPSISITNSEWDRGTTQFVSVPSNLLLDADNGTFEDNTPASWNIQSLTSEASGVFSSTTARTGSYSGDFGLAVNSAVNGELELYEFTTPINVINGQDYALELFYYENGNFAPPINQKANIYYKIKGTNIITNKIFLDNQNFTDTWIPLNLNFTAASDQINIVMCIEFLEEVTFGGGGFFIDDVSVKGPIQYLTEKKPIKSGVGCGFKDFPMRWKNDLGGWEQWNFTRYGTFKENVSNKVNIKRDITENWDDTFINGDTQYDTISQTVRQSITIRSELLTQDEQKKY